MLKIFSTAPEIVQIFVTGGTRNYHLTTPWEANGENFVKMTVFLLKFDLAEAFCKGQSVRLLRLNVFEIWYSSSTI